TAEDVEAKESIKPTETTTYGESYAQIARENVTQQTDARSTLYLEEVKLCKLRQEQVLLKNDILKKELEVLTMELDKVKLEMEVLSAKKQFYCAGGAPASPASFN
ncbi:unnamed protein product, partial [Heligmosomoides polygyrus]|uniref:PRKG1_interact domain-containing protein n=1 Tax=Heligmosomoides polygyrus TaxID=6339 RepID=A0A183GWU1_HELPZ